MLRKGFKVFLASLMMISTVAYAPTSSPIFTPITAEATNTRASITLAERTTTTLSFNVVYPVSGAWGNRIELQDRVTGHWREVGNSFHVTNGTYTFAGLVPNRSYMGRLTYYQNGWRTVDLVVSTAAYPSITSAQRTATTLSFNVTFPVSGAWGNRIELQDTVTGQWREVGNSFHATNGTYTFTGLVSNRLYMGRLTYYQHGWRTVDFFVSTTDGTINAAPWATATSNNNATTFTTNANNVMSITTTQLVNSRFLKTFQITPNRYYRFTVEVHSNARLSQDVGANVLFHFNDGWSRWGHDNYNHHANNTWQTLEVQFNSGSHSNVTIELAQGFFWGNYAHGTTQFRNLRLEEMAPSQSTNWRVLNVIPRHVDFNNRRISIDANDISNIQNHGPRWAQTIARMSNNQMSATVTTVVLEDSINRWYNIWNSFWPGSSQIHHMLRRNGINPRDFDYIMVTARTYCPVTRVNIPMPDWGGLAWNYSGVAYGMQHTPTARGTTWWNDFGHPGAYVHEFMHALEFYSGIGNIVDHANNFTLNDGRHPPHYFQYPGFGYNMFYVQFLRRQLRVRTNTGTAVAGQSNFGVPSTVFTRQRFTPRKLVYELPFR